jgi:hypothetical protein
MEEHVNKILKPDKLTYADLKKHMEKRLYLKEVNSGNLPLPDRFVVKRHCATAKRFCSQEFKINPVPDISKQWQASPYHGGMDTDLIFVDQIKLSKGYD